MIFKVTVPLTAGIPEIAPERRPMSGASGVFFQEVGSDCFIRFDDDGDYVPLSAGKQLQILFGNRRVQQLHVHNDNTPGASSLVVLGFTQGEKVEV